MPTLKQFAARTGLRKQRRWIERHSGRYPKGNGIILL